VFPHALLGIFAACLGLLLVYAAAMLTTALLAWRRMVDPPRTPADHAVTILIPSHHEGEGVVDTIRTLLKQDHHGSIAIWVLIDDASDTSVEALARAWPWERTDAKRHRVFADAKREVILVECGVASKTDKLNAVLGDVKTPRLAILDADHRADPAWIRLALAKMESAGARVVQSRRRPLAALRLAQIWDSLQNHVGNEALNRALAASGHTVFFTGTTAVFDSALFEKRRFGRSITEDTYLSLELLSDGEWIAYDGIGGSYEEVAPSVESFIARRRRWAAGHTHAFFTHLKRILRGPKHTSRIVLVLHGIFYLIPAVVLVSLWALAAHDLIQFPRSLLAVWGLATALFAAVLFSLVGWRGRRWTDLLVALLWCAPQAAFVTVYLYRWSGAEGYYYLLSFPHEDAFRIPIGVALFAPLVSLLLAAKPVGGAGPVRLFLGVITYPLMLVIDLYSALLGVADLLMGRPVWTKIVRENVVATDAVPEAIRQTMTTANVQSSRFERLLWLPAFGLFAILANDLLSPSDCGQVRPFLWRPLLIHRRHEVDLDLAVKTVRLDNEQLSATFDLVVRGSNAALKTTFTLDGKATPEVVTLPLGWEKHSVTAEMRGDGFICHRTRHFSTVVKEIVGKNLLINGEPFLVKGMIPSFSTNQIHLDFPTGLAQIKATGANAIRVYHEPRAEVLDAAASEQLLVLAQPDRSTWENLDLASASDREKLIDRYRALVDDTEGYPYLLMDNLGNELELTGKLDSAVPDVKALITSARASGARFPLSYSTYYTFVDYPVDVVGINMLDTGSTYWVKALGLVAKLDKPFFATELGGFVAFHERLPWELRAARIKEEWAHLQRAGAIGAFFFESHDNWAQSVPPGEVNNPLAADQPDDVRGFWDEKNQPKPELAAVVRAFRDISAKTAPEVLPAGATNVRTTFTNLRPYTLRGVLSQTGLDLGDLGPKEERTVMVPIGRDGTTALTFHYSTHHGLAGVTELVVHAPRLAERPIVTNDDYADGRLADSRTLHVIVPVDWPTIVVNGKRFDRPADGKLEVPMRGPFYEVEALKSEPSRLQFRLPNVKGGILLLRGVGTEHVTVTAAGQTTEIETHSYRDNLVPLDRIHAKPGDEIVVKLTRDRTEYLSARYSPDHHPIAVEVDPPLVFAPMTVDIAR
jgi:cellulose synthase/poly-beta-1,6-N-acetylglucosamine synthase-like glycosyltransferase